MLYNTNQWRGVLCLGSSGPTLLSQNPATAGTWTYLVLERSGSTVTLYVNGQQAAQTTGVTGALNTSTNALSIGRLTGGSDYFNGSIDEVAIYNTALSASQIWNHYTAALGGTPTPTPTNTPTATPTAAPTPTFAPTSTTDPVVMTAGDIACNTTDNGYSGGNGTSSNCEQKATSNELSGLSAVLDLGDNQYENGALTEFQSVYDPTWGKQKAITYPAAGNHEYQTSGASGYYTYFGSAASPQDTNCTSNCKGYYSYNLGAWHMIVLNSECSSVGGCNAGSAQEQWLKADLAAHTNVCTLAYWHRALFSSGQSLGYSGVHDLWVDLYNARASLVLNGHDHDYERFAPQDPSGNYDPNHGITEMIVGTGGFSHFSFNSTAANSLVRDNTTFGVLKLTLHSNWYQWQFLPDSQSGNGTFTDSGSAACR
jgi:hypothetical protein